MKFTRTMMLVAVACGILSPLGSGRAVPQEATAAPGSITSVTDPMSCQVVQRRDDNVGNILFVGTYSGNVDGFQGQSVLRPGMTGIPQGWTPLIEVTIVDGHFEGILRQPAGGFYDLQIRPTFLGQVGQPATVLVVGVGEVFITAGQSNATNNGTPTGTLPNPLVTCFDDGAGEGFDPTYPGAYWRWGYDPQPAIDGSNLGSVWPTMATSLSEALGVPVGMYAVGFGGTSLEDWLPEAALPPSLTTTPDVVLFDRLINAIQYFTVRGGVRAVLWDQGETDYAANIDPAVYEANLRFLIEMSRAVSGVPVKWMVAQATTPLTDNIAERSGLEQAQAAVVDNELTFPGPNTDVIGLSFRVFGPDGPLHFNASGLELLGGYWEFYVANMPGFLNTGWLPPPN